MGDTLFEPGAANASSKLHKVKKIILLKPTVFGLLNTKTHFKCPSILRLEIINMVIVVYADANTFTKKGNFLFY